MTRRGVILLAFVAMSLIVGFMAGYRFRISQEHAPGRRYLPPVPDEVAVEAEYTGTGWYAFPSPTISATVIVPPVAASPVGSAKSDTRGSRLRPVDAPKRARHFVFGLASWHATGRSGLYAAACRPLRRAMGIGRWRGRQVIVTRGRKGIVVRLNDWCGSRTKLIDLSDEAFRFFAPLSRGVVRVSVHW